MTEASGSETAPPDAAADGTREPTPADWRAALPEDLRRTAEKFATPADVLRSYGALERRLGRSVVVPARDAGRAEREAFYNRLGRPETPDGYRIAVPDGVPDEMRPAAGDEARKRSFREAMHAAGATPETVQAAVDWFYRHAAEAGAASRVAETRSESRAHAEAETEMRREWGADFDRTLELARRAAHHFGGTALSKLMDDSGLGNHPAWLRAFARIGVEMAEDGVLTGGPADDARSAQERIDAIMAEHYGKPSYAAAAVQDELRALYESIYGTGPARPDAA